MFTTLRQREQHGYTLVEIIVVVAIIGILAAFSGVAFSEYREAARDAKRQATLSEIAKVFETYRSITGSLPDCGNGFIIEKNGATADFRLYPPGPNTICDTDDLSSIENFFTNNYPGDIVDPLGADNMEHIYFYDSVHYCADGSGPPLLYAKLEQPENANREEVCGSTGSNNDGGYLTTYGEPSYVYVIPLH